jgi:hypothetical protein
MRAALPRINDSHLEDTMAKTEATPKACELYIEDLGKVTGGVFRPTEAGGEGGRPPQNTGIVAEDGGNAPTTSCFGEGTGSGTTTLALGEEGSTPPKFTTLALGEEGSTPPVFKPV